MLPYQELIAEAVAAENRARVIRAQADQLRCACPHLWEATQYTPDYKPGYTDPGDLPGTMGVDFRGPQYVSAVTTPKWTRTCKKCGYSQTTTRKKTVGGELQHEKPDFGDGHHF